MTTGSHCLMRVIRPATTQVYQLNVPWPDTWLYMACQDCLPHAAALGPWPCTPDLQPEATLLRHVLSRHAPVHPSDWQFDRQARGKPFVRNHPIAFNLAHTRATWVCAVSTSHTVGVDIERTDRICQPLRVAQRYFSDAESIDLRNMPEPARTQRFLQYWTVKEACLKALGTGLSHHLSLIRVSMAQDTPCVITTIPSLETSKIHLLSPTPGHMLAGCCLPGLHPI